MAKSDKKAMQYRLDGMTYAWDMHQLNNQGDRHGNINYNRIYSSSIHFCDGGV